MPNFNKSLATQLRRTFCRPPTSVAATFLLFSFFIFFLFSSGFIDSSFLTTARTWLQRKPDSPPVCWLKKPADIHRFSPNRTTLSKTLIKQSSNKSCPSYFRWIHEDLKAWKETGITKKTVKSGRRWAHFRVVIVDGRAYVEKYKRRSIQTRSMFTIWGIMQLLRYYPQRLPDLEIMFDSNDRPVVNEKEYSFRRRMWGPPPPPPPVFRYCSDNRSLDIVFPDWSFWGWAECNIKPWGDVLKDIKEGNKRIKWKDRVPYAYWRGNPYVAPTRRDLLKCNVSDQIDWNTRLYIQSWEDEKNQGFKQSKLEDQCNHRYKIYTEGWAWSVSEKYILACDSMTLYIRSRFHDFFIRGMEPLKHFWPISDTNKCNSLKFAVEWGNNHTDQAQAIGEAASKFIEEEMSMDYVYDYMFHLLNEYGKLFKYKPAIPTGAIELCPEAIVCPTNTTWAHFMEESTIISPSRTTPCNLPPYDPKPISNLLQRYSNSINKVEMWEEEYWHNQNNNQ